MRLGEVLALEWGDVDWHSQYILVQRAFRHGRVTLTKNSRARRVDMSDQLASALRELLIKRKREGLAAGKSTPYAPSKNRKATTF